MYYIPIERRGTAVVSTSAWHAGDLGSILDRACYILGVKTWLSTFLCLSDETLKAVGPLLSGVYVRAGFVGVLDFLESP